MAFINIGDLLKPKTDGGSAYVNVRTDVEIKEGQRLIFIKKADKYKNLVLKGTMTQAEADAKLANIQDFVLGSILVAPLDNN